MTFIALSAVLLLACALFLTRAVLTERAYRRVLRFGIAVPGEVVDTTTRALYNGGQRITPVVRYWVDGVQHRALVLNRAPAALGGTVDLVVDELDPTSPWARYENNVSPTLLALGALTVMSALMLGSAFA